MFLEMAIRPNPLQPRRSARADGAPQRPRSRRHSGATAFVQVVCVVALVALVITGNIFDFHIDFIIYAVIIAIAFGLGPDDIMELAKGYIRKRL